jgi:hypothetical protein
MLIGLAHGKCSSRTKQEDSSQILRSGFGQSLADPLRGVEKSSSIMTQSRKEVLTPRCSSALTNDNTATMQPKNGFDARNGP